MSNIKPGVMKIHNMKPYNQKLDKKRVSEIETDSELNLDKVLNSRCYCAVGLPWEPGHVHMALPCEHMFHEACTNKLKSKYPGNPICPLCNRQIDSFTTLLDESLHYQRFADILSNTNYDNMSTNTTLGFIDSIFDLASVFTKVFTAQNYNDGKEICKRALALNNVTLKVHGMGRIKMEKQKVYICNHVALTEMFILYYLLSPGFLASSMVNDSPFGKKLQQVVPVLTFNRGDKNRKINIVEQMKHFVEKHGSICLFPEGMMKHPDTLTRFRTGAFHIGKPVYAITIRHNDVIGDGYVNTFLYKLGAKKDVNIEVNILGPYYPPFDEAKIEKIRNDMALHGRMLLSRVSNKDVDDKKERAMTT